MKIRSVLLGFLILTAGASAAFSQAKTSMQYLEDASRYYLAREYKQAIPSYEKALELEKKERKLSKDLWFVLIDNLAISYGITGDLKKSMAVIEYGISKEPTYPIFYYNAACNYGETDDEENAVKYLRLAYKYKDNMIKGEVFPDPATDSSFERLMKRASFSKAVAEMENASSGSAAKNEYFGCGKQDYRCQIDALTRSQKEDPKNPENYYNMGVVFQRAGAHAEAIQTLNMYIVIPGVKPEFLADGYNLRGISEKALNQFDAAFADYSKAIELDPKRAEFWINRGNVSIRLKKPDNAMADYNRAIVLDPKSSLAYANRGHLYFESSKYDEAFRDLAKAIDIDPTNAEPFYTRAMMYGKNGEFSKAVNDLDQYIYLNPNNPQYLADAYLNRGMAYAMLHKPEPAEKDFNRAIELSPKYIDAYEARAKLYRLLKKDGLAAADERKVAELTGKAPNENDE